jgi:hypothetical protein
LDVLDAAEPAQIAAASTAGPVALARPSVSPKWRIGIGPLARARSLLARTEAFGPVLVVSMVLVLIIGAGFSARPGDPTVFVHFGRDFVSVLHPPTGAVIAPRTGYDGQYFWALAQDPLLLHSRTVAAIPGYRLDRIVYPALAYALAVGRVNAIPWTLLAVNVGAVLALTAAFGSYARRRGWSAWWALAVGLLPGLQFGILGDLGGPLAVTFMLGGLMAWERKQRWLAAGLLTLAVLTREPMLLAVAAIAIEAVVQWWGRRHEPGALSRSARAVLPAVALPGAAFLAWQAYVSSRHAPGTLPPASAFQWPLVSLLDQATGTVRGGPSLSNVWDLAYLAAIGAGIAAAFKLIRRGISAPAVAAVLFGVLVLILPYGTDWGYARETAPLFAVLLLGGLDRAARPAIAVCLAVGGLGALIPFMVA